jgi:hypothetical protein
LTFKSELRAGSAAASLLRAAELAGCRAGHGDAVLTLLADRNTLIENFQIVAGEHVSCARIDRTGRLLPLIAGGDCKSHGNHKSQSSHDAFSRWPLVRKFAPTVRSIKRIRLIQSMAGALSCRR